ncbi:MAG: TIGR01777 family protein [Sideroxydans sp.]|nr:TIGR01777 family protein [Sideroxydans sp.]
MRVLITGGTGLIGRALCRALLADGHHLTVLSRSYEAVKEKCGRDVIALSSLGSWWHNETFDAIINLAGEPIIDRKWTNPQKRCIWESRVGLTRKLVHRIANVERKPTVLLSGSAVGYYGSRGDTPLDESSGQGDDFGAKLCAAWEQAAMKAAEESGVRVCLLRTGAVLSRDGGMLGRMLPAFRWGLGARLGNGQQWLSWVHIDDYVAMTLKLLADPRASGAYNMTAPQPVTNAEFTAALARILCRPALFAAPAWLLRMALGERAGLLLEGQRVLPVRMGELGYRFSHPELKGALFNLLI